MHIARSAGILLHPTSLSGATGIGELGAQAYAFVDFLARYGLRYWQILPLGPTGYGNSPYQSLSAFAGNPLLVSLAKLIDDGLLASSDIPTALARFASRVDYGTVIPYKTAVLKHAWERFCSTRPPQLTAAFDAFRDQHADWLEDYALFIALKNHFGGGSWLDWPVPLARRQSQALRTWRETLATAIEFAAFEQFLFFKHWQELKTYAEERGIRVIGDMPIFVAHDSADVWANQERFRLRDDGRPQVVAGVPPDYFSETGQRWGNPLYRWDIMEANDFAWWKARLRHTLALVDIVRIDHFRGFEAYWEIPGDAETAVQGRWVKGPGERLFQALQQAFGDLPIIAEDLGVITPGVEALRDRFNLPGMKVLQFAFGGESSNPYLPHNYTRRCVAYTGTHDNETIRGWWEKPAHARSDAERAALEREREHARKYLSIFAEKDIHWHFIRAVFASVADLAVVPLQDVLGLDNSARMNEPGIPNGNWEWRFADGDLSSEVGERLGELVALYGRQHPSNA